MKVKEYISDCINSLGDIIRDKEFDLDQLERKSDDLRKEIYLLELKQEVYKNYLANGRRIKNGSN